MSKPCILTIDDQPEVGSAVKRDLEDLESHFDIVNVESAAEAWDVLEDMDAEQIPVLVIVSDQVMPEMTGSEFLGSVETDGRFQHTRKILLTGQATHSDTIEAINRGRIERYISKPWQADDFLKEVRVLATQAAIGYDCDIQSLMPVLDNMEVMKSQRLG